MLPARVGFNDFWRIMQITILCLSLLNYPLLSLSLRALFCFLFFFGKFTTFPYRRRRRPSNSYCRLPSWFNERCPLISSRLLRNYGVSIKTRNGGSEKSSMSDIKNLHPRLPHYIISKTRRTSNQSGILHSRLFPLLFPLVLFSLSFGFAIHLHLRTHRTITRIDTTKRNRFPTKPVVNINLNLYRLDSGFGFLFFN